MFVADAISLQAAAPPKRPNVVFILGDDMGQGDLGSYNPESKIPTPHLDRLARQGMRFTDAHSGSSVCSPTRYGLLTGRYAWRTSLQRHVLRPYDPPLIEKGRLTLPEMLRQNGHMTACIGKWHLGSEWPRPDKTKPPDFTQPIAEGPTTRGFDYYFGTDVPNHPPYCFIENNRTVGQPTGQRTEANLDGVPGPMLPGWRFDEILPTLARKAVGYLEERAKDKKPFFLYFALTSPHEPIQPSERFRNKSGIAPVADFIMETDWAAGEVLASLEALGLSENTLVVFTADNGAAQHQGAAMKAAGQHRSLAWRAAKGSIYEGGHRVPFIARWPGHIQADSTSDELICLGDMMATVASLLSVKLPDNAGEDSINILPVMLGEKGSAPLREAIVHHDANGVFAIRQGDWKLIPAQTPPPSGAKSPSQPIACELYNLAADPHETTNVDTKHPEIVTRLTALLERYRKEDRSRP